MYSFLVFKQERNILRVQIQSRHTSSKVLNLWIETNAGPNPISGWYCQCKSGARVFFFFFQRRKRIHLPTLCGTQPEQYPLNSKLISGSKVMSHLAVFRRSPISYEQQLFPLSILPSLSVPFFLLSRF